MSDYPFEKIEALSEDEYKAFFPAPLDRDYFDDWMAYLSEIFGSPVPPARATAYFKALSAVSFTNAELGKAGDWIVAHNERFPVPAHFINCPDLSRNPAKGG